jgi:hypothetical protein
MLKMQRLKAKTDVCKHCVVFAMIPLLGHSVARKLEVIECKNGAKIFGPMKSYHFMQEWHLKWLCYIKNSIQA